MSSSSSFKPPSEVIPFTKSNEDWYFIKQDVVLVDGLYKITARIRNDVFEKELEVCYATSYGSKLMEDVNELLDGAISNWIYEMVDASEKWEGVDWDKIEVQEHVEKALKALHDARYDVFTLINSVGLDKVIEMNDSDSHPLGSEIKSLEDYSFNTDDLLQQVLIPLAREGKLTFTVSANGIVLI